VVAAPGRSSGRTVPRATGLSEAPSSLQPGAQQMPKCARTLTTAGNVAPLLPSDHLLNQHGRSHAHVGSVEIALGPAGYEARGAGAKPRIPDPAVGGRGSESSGRLCRSAKPRAQFGGREKNVDCCRARFV
jgi:hypothetical protein